MTDVRRCGSQPSAKGPAEHFTGNVRIDPLFDLPDILEGRSSLAESSTER